MLPVPADRRVRGLGRERLGAVGRGMAARERDELLRLSSPVESRARQRHRYDRVLFGDDHLQRRGRDELDRVGRVVGDELLERLDRDPRRDATVATSRM